MKAGGNEHRAPLRIILQNFLNHVETLERRRNSADDQYDKEFQDLKILSESLKGLPAFSCKEGEKEVNRRKNRYKDILPFDCTRVSLSEIVGIPGSDYINANYIRGASGSQAYIASQGPLVHTVTDFWRMVVECDVQVIVMACNEEEAGKHKCECYWSESDSEAKAYGPYSVRLLKSRRMCNDFNLRTMELTYTNSAGESVTRTVVQFHYWAWPDHGVPALVRPLLDMVRLIRDCQASETLPLLIHCSAGCGRTGTICAIDYVWGLLRAGKLTEDFSLFELIADMRRQRVAMVQTKDQYILVHRALRELFIEQLKMIDAHPYENLDVNGHPLICPPQEIRIDPSYETIFVKVNSDDVLEVNEEDDVCREEPMDQIPWPVLQYQSSVAVIESVPPLPDKKRRHDSSSGQASPVSTSAATTPGGETTGSKSKSSYDNVSDSSKESSPPASLERLLLMKASLLDKEPLQQPSQQPAQQPPQQLPPSPKEPDSTITPKSSGLVRKSSILKIRSFFEKSQSEPRGEKKTGSKFSSSNARKASSFRLREAPAKFYRSLEAAENSEAPPQQTSQPEKLSLLAVPANHVEEETSVQFETKPSLPVKRSKSMKVYRGFDVHEETERVVATTTMTTTTPITTAAASSTPPPPPLGMSDVVVSKVPSITYISSKEKLQPSSREPEIDLRMRPKSPEEDGRVVPLVTSSLDRIREQRNTTAQAFLSSSAALPVGGSLDRSVVQSKVVPTYVNVLMRNQEAAHSSRLDEDTRQLLQDCQAYLMHDDSPTATSTEVAIVSREQPNIRRSATQAKKTKDRSTKERRHSLKQAVGPEVVDAGSRQEIGGTRCSSESLEGKALRVEEAEEVKTNRKKAHEYEAIWLSAGGGKPPSSSSPPLRLAEPEEEKCDSNSSSGTVKDSVFVQKSDEIRLLLAELRTPQREECAKQQSGTHTAATSSSVGVTPLSPRLHPDRVLSELQELVERANRSKEEAIKSEASLFLSVNNNSTTTRAASSSPSTSQKSRLSQGGATPPSPTQYSGPSFAAPTSLSSTPSPGLITPVPIKMATPAPYSSNPPVSTEPRAPAFRPPPPYPTKLYVKLPPLAQEPAPPVLPAPSAVSAPSAAQQVLNPSMAGTSVSLTSTSPKMQQRRLPPEYKAPPPVQRSIPTPSSSSGVSVKATQQQQLLPQPVAPPRSKRQTASHLTPAVSFPKGPPIPTRSFVPPSASAHSAPGIDVDAVAAVMAATAENSSARTANSASSGSSSPTTAANKALSKALGKFHATAASFKTKLATQFGDATRDTEGSSSATANPNPSAASKMERESSFVKPTVVYVGDGVTVVSTSEATSYVRKKQQYL